MVYNCTKCYFVFERTAEPSNCPNCESQNIIEANQVEYHALKRLKDKQQEDR